MDQAIAAYTSGSAFAEFEEKEKGKLIPGMLADFVVLDRDITSVSAEKMLGRKSCAPSWAVNRLRSKIALRSRFST